MVGVYPGFPGLGVLHSYIHIPAGDALESEGFGIALSQHRKPSLS